MDASPPQKRVDPWASWGPCKEGEDAAALERLASGRPALFADSKLVSSRCSRLSFYKAHRLIELVFVRDDCTQRAFVLDDHRHTRWLNGQTYPFEVTNVAESLALTRSSAADYLRFYLYFFRDDDGDAFVLIEAGDEVWPADDVGDRGEDQGEALTLETARGRARPLLVQGPDAQGRWLVEVTIAYYGDLFGASFALEPRGENTMIDDEPIGELGGLLVPQVPSLGLEEQAHNGATAEQILQLSSRLGQALDQATAGLLSSEALDDIYSDKEYIEARLVHEAAALFSAGAIDEAIQPWTTLAGLNSQLVSIGGILAEQADDSADARAIAEFTQDIADAASIARGRALLLMSVNQRLSRSPAEAAKSAEAARQEFEPIKKSGRRLSRIASILVMIAEAGGLGASGIAQLLGSQYENASLTFLQAKNVLEKVRTYFLQAGDDEVSLAATVADISAYGNASRSALLTGAVSSGRFEDASRHIVAMLKSSLEVETDSLPDWVQQLNELSRRQLQGSLAYINAEIAASRQNWGQAEQQLDEADEEWTRTVEQAVALGIPQGRQLAETTRATSTQVIGAFRRRIIRERQLYAEMAKLENSIKDLETVNDRLHKEILEMAKLPRIASTQGEITMNDKKIARGHIVSGGNAQGHVVSGGRVEGDLTYAGNDVVYGHKTTEMDFSQIWQQHASEIDLAELAKELDALLPRLESSGGGEHDTEIGAVAVAQKAAAQNDGPKTLKWLKTAGKWVLEAAKDIAPIVVKVLDIVL